MTAEAQGFKAQTGTVCPLDQANVDTDQIIPKQFLTSVSRKGFGKHLFFDWRYNKGEPLTVNNDFVLNFPQHQGATVLLTRENFGCGSSREHAPWALTDYGFKVIIATSFADIFYGNCINNQLLPVKLSDEQIQVLFDAVAASSSVEITVDLQAQTVSCNEHEFAFEIGDAHKFTLISGLDSIGQTLLDEEKITQFEHARQTWQ
ncbi:3-isopropylmalate dehydratase small subunit [Alteromonas sp. 5E99-2]|uniref:3-isopropylmalate dehydratase small subunit n=1 Tax=Alteromonas sp. 5E99-2 TaxID=2817683 RepID=UPI001A98D0AE|nr:3-isopropylmalate dehydratase small subunit [Alteromonas sp. 5E99-2]MBO1254175.1 3-isopropylmalate dehydratase small subunit [Alteromonas sp. 5E99-2]